MGISNGRLIARLAGFGGAVLLAASPAFAADPDALKDEKARLSDQADKKVAGTVEKLQGDSLTLKPYGGQGSERFKIGRSVPVYEGSGKSSLGSLRTGQDVRVWAKNDQALGVEVLTADQAQAARANPEGEESKEKQASGDTAKQKRETIAKADSFQNGRVTEASGDQLVLDPYQKQAGKARLRLPGDVPVYSGDEKVSRDKLKPGTDVRVFYDVEGSQEPKVVAVELLDEREASELRNAERNVPEHEE